MTPEQIRLEVEQLADRRERPAWYAAHPGYVLKPRAISGLTKSSRKPSNVLTKKVAWFIRWSVPKQYRLGGRKNSAGNYQGKDKRTGNVIMTCNAADKGRPDVEYYFSFCPSFLCEIKIKDKQSEAQRKYQSILEQQGNYYCIVHSFDEFMEHWQRFCSRYVPFPSGCISVIGGDICQY